MATPLQQKIETMAKGAAAAHGVVLVAARFGGQQGRSTLEVLLETPEGGSPDVEVCAAVSRLLSAQLDVADIISGKYTLEVSSPGLERPLQNAADCARFVGKGAAFKFAVPQTLNGQPVGAAKGTLAAVEAETITLAMPAGTLVFPFSVVHRAELAPTAEELAAFMGFHTKPKRGTAHPLKPAAKKAAAKPKASTKESA